MPKLQPFPSHTQLLHTPPNCTYGLVREGQDRKLCFSGNNSNLKYICEAFIEKHMALNLSIRRTEKNSVLTVWS